MATEKGKEALQSRSGFYRTLGEAVAGGLRRAVLVGLVVMAAVLRVPAQHTAADNGVTAMNQSFYVDGSNMLHLVGEVRNDTGQAIELVNIQASLVDAGGKAFDGTQGYTEINVLQPGDVSSFDVTKFPAPANLATYKLHMTWDKASSRQAGGQTVVNDAPFDDGTGFVHISGQVINSGAGTAAGIKVIATYYHDDGTVAFVWDDHSDPSTIPAGGSAQFELVSHVHPYATYKVQVAGRASSS